MTLSGTTTFESTVQQIIEDAYSECTVLGVDETIDAENLKKSLRLFNRMIKSFQTRGLNLWKKKIGILFLQKDQETYQLYSGSSDHYVDNESYLQRTLPSDMAVGSLTITTSDTTGMSAGDYIGIQNDDDKFQWSTISSVIDSSDVLINDALTVKASSGNYVYTYTSKLDTPFNIYSANRFSNTNLEVPLNDLSYEDFFDLPNKSNTGTVNSCNFDRQLSKYIIRLWPVPENVDFQLKFTHTERIQDVTSTTQTIDFPQEWEDAIVLNLAVRIAVMFGKGEGDNFNELKSEANEALNNALAFDSEGGSIFLQPDERYS